MTKIKRYSYRDVECAVNDIIRQINTSVWRPDYVVGITRGGLTPAILISQYLDIPMHTLKVSLRNHIDTESNCWMAEEAFGCVPEEERQKYSSRWDPSKRRKILIVDDINDSGATFDWIMTDWQKNCFPKEDKVWDTVWGENVRFASLVENTTTDCESDYTAESINKDEDNIWCQFPWENWWMDA
jgi:hypoxanthine phosphoribosyltransferase